MVTSSSYIVRTSDWSATGFRALCRGLLGEGFDLGSDGIAQQTACALLIPISFWTGWIDSVRFISLITVIGLALGSLSACSQPESRSKRWRPVTLLRVCL